mmetsp:Transcript_3543/g.9173  ORF Transcript_3543/g.9173 Transcript_3543/m.9173 type:complete len:259 (-) Transcript_3543:1180-1956(-)
MSGAGGPRRVQHLLHPRPRGAEGVLDARPLRHSQARRRAGGDRRRRVRGAAGGQPAAAARARGGRGDGPAILQPSWRLARGCAQRQPGGCHRAHLHHGGRHEATAGLVRVCVGECDLRLQRALHVLRRPGHARRGAVAPARGHPRGDRRARRAGLQGGDSARAEHRRVRPRHEPEAPLRRPARVRRRRARHRASAFRHLASEVHERLGGERGRRAPEAHARVPHTRAVGRRRGAQEDGPWVHGREVSPDRGAHSQGDP